MKKQCSVAGCNQKVLARGWCSKHWQRWSRYGDPSITKKAANGAGHTRGKGYRGHQIQGITKFDHVRIIEEILKHPLPVGVVVHHVNEIKTDNRNSNLVVCPDRAYHNLLHARMNAIKACGDPNKRKCGYCHEYDFVENLRVYVWKTKTSSVHKECARIYQRNKRR